MKIKGKKVRLTKEMAWEWCLKQWAYVYRMRGKYGVEAAKERFLEIHKIEDVDNDCFFCQYDSENKSGCKSCPGRIQSNYDTYKFNKLWCHQFGKNYEYNPEEFYKYLKELDKQRKR